LKLQNGKSCMRNFVTQMSSHLNWQLSFLEAFKSDFETQRDFEKWWSLRVVDFTGRDMSRLWSSGDSWQQVADILTATVEVRDLSGKGPSVETEVNLQTVIRESDYQRQSTILRAKLKELLVLRTSVSPELVPLVDGYFETLQKYMHRREVSSSGRMAGGYVMPSLDYVTRETLRKLDELDLQFKQLDPKPEIQPDAASQSVDTAVRH
jgi:hypothetical protein